MRFCRGEVFSPGKWKCSRGFKPLPSLEGSATRLLAPSHSEEAKRPKNLQILRLAFGGLRMTK